MTRQKIEITPDELKGMFVEVKNASNGEDSEKSIFRTITMSYQNKILQITPELLDGFFDVAVANKIDNWCVSALALEFIELAWGDNTAGGKERLALRYINEMNSGMRELESDKNNAEYYAKISRNIMRVVCKSPELDTTVLDSINELLEKCSCSSQSKQFGFIYECASNMKDAIEVRQVLQSMTNNDASKPRGPKALLRTMNNLNNAVFQSKLG